jgi:hypothetical protein
MMKPTTLMIGLMVVWMGLLPLAKAETIYTWIDKDGVKQFSNEPPPEAIEHYQKFEAPSQSSTDQDNTQERRQSYDAMVEAAKYDAQRIEQERLNKARAREARQKQKAEKQLQVKVDAERKRLKQLIEKAQNRGLSRTYSQGMRQNKVDQFQKQLDQLKTSPQAYFDNQTTQGADATEPQSDQ